MSESIKLGQLITTAAQRDAIHVAIAPVIAACDLFPGQPVGVVRESGCDKAVPSKSPIGIVDPFLQPQVVTKGSRFWLLLLPNTVTSLRHEWAHPAFETELQHDSPSIDPLDIRERSRKWLVEFAGHVDLDLDGLLIAAERCQTRGEWITQHGGESWRDHWYEHKDEFWHHYEIYTGKVVQDKDATMFSCSC